MEVAEFSSLADSEAAAPPTAPGERSRYPVSAVGFVELPAQDRTILLAKCSNRRYAKGSPMFAQGEAHSLNFLIDHGLVRTYYTSVTGKEITLSYWSDGDLIGGPDFLHTRTAHIWSARAVDETRVWSISPDDLDLLVQRRPAIAQFVIASLTFKVAWLSGLLQAFGTQSVVFRLAHLLLRLAEMHGIRSTNGEILIRHHFTQEDLANMVGATRQWVSTTLRYFQRDDIVYSAKGKLVIRNIELLQRIVGEAGRPASVEPDERGAKPRR
ncbi:MAG: Crp/Fnr family transcriptional regulator [Casimicrobiaceae bacterium]